MVPCGVKYIIGTIFRSSCSRGALLEGVLEVEQDAAPAAVSRTHGLGRPGSPFGLTKKPRHWLADVDGLKAEQSAAKRVKSPVGPPESTVPAPEIAAMERRKACADRGSPFAGRHAGRARLQRCASRRSVPLM